MSSTLGFAFAMRYAPESVGKTDRVIESVIRKLRTRSDVGYKKYEVTMEREDLGILAWLDELQNELCDASAYAERAKWMLVGMDRMRQAIIEWDLETLGKMREEMMRRGAGVDFLVEIGRPQSSPWLISGRKSNGNGR